MRNNIIMKRLAALLLCLVCVIGGGCSDDTKQAAEPEPAGSVYQIWLSEEWRPCYLHWLPEGGLLVGSVEP